MSSKKHRAPRWLRNLWIVLSCAPTGFITLDHGERGPETDQNGVEFGRNCLTPGVCHNQNLCLGTCKLF